MKETAVPAEWFDRWWAPRDFFAAVRALQDQLPAAEQLTRPEFRPLLEAYAAGLSTAIRAETEHLTLRLQDDRFPDFDVRIGNTILPFELVEAGRPGHRRDEEYREEARRTAAGLPPRKEIFDPAGEETQAISAIKEAVARKAAKFDTPPPHLLVYVNFWIFDTPPLSDRAFGELVAPWYERFAEIWLLWGLNAIRCWPDPRRFAAEAPPPGLRPSKDT